MGLLGFKIKKFWEGMTEKQFKIKIAKVKKVEKQIKKLQSSIAPTELELVSHLSKKFKSKDKFNAWLINNEIPGFVHLLMLLHFKNQKHGIGKEKEKAEK